MRRVPPVTTFGTLRRSGKRSRTFTSFNPNGTADATCVHTRTIDGTLIMTLQQGSDGRVTGTAVTTTGWTVVAVSAGCNPANMVIGARNSVDWNIPVTGTSQSLAFNAEQPYSAVPFTGGRVDGSRTLTFQGGLTSGVVSGTMTLVDTAQGSSQGTPLTWNGSTTLAVILR